MKPDQMKRAIVAKLKKKVDMPKWYYARLEKCKLCSYNTSNNDKLTIKDKLRVAHNLGKDACLVCTCGVEDKSSDAEESCPKGKWDKEVTIPANTLEIEVKSNKVTVEYSKEEACYIAEYGDIDAHSDSRIFVEILDEVEEISVKSSCGCTTTTLTYTADGKGIEVSYDTARIGSFSKRVTLSYLKGGETRKTIIIIRGVVLDN